MLVDGSFMANGVTESNISALLTIESENCERRICELSELADDAAAFAVQHITDGYGVYEVLSLFDGLMPSDAPEPHEYALDENRPRLSSYLKRAIVADRAVFTELFLSRLSARGVVLSESDFLEDEHSDESFVYVKNRLADEAYDVFSQEMESARVSYAAGFREAVREVAEGRAEYCLLPLEERAGARIPSISALLFAEDLKISSVTPVFGFDGTADMKYALVSRHFTVPPVRKDDDRYLEIRLGNDSVSVAELFSAAAYYGITVYRINTAVFTTDDGDAQFVNVVFKTSGASFVPLLAYLTLFSDSCTEVGIYTNLE